MPQVNESSWIMMSLILLSSLAFTGSVCHFASPVMFFRLRCLLSISFATIL